MRGDGLLSCRVITVSQTAGVGVDLEGVGRPFQILAVGSMG